MTQIREAHEKFLFEAGPIEDPIGPRKVPRQFFAPLPVGHPAACSGQLGLGPHASEPAPERPQFTAVIRDRRIGLGQQGAQPRLRHDGACQSQHQSSTLRAIGADHGLHLNVTPGRIGVLDCTPHNSVNFATCADVAGVNGRRFLAHP